MIKIFLRGKALIFFALFLVIVLPAWSGPLYTHFLILIFLYGFLGTCWNILGGYAGQFSFGHAAYFGFGAYTSTVLFVHLGLSPWIGMIAGAVTGGLFGIFSGYLSFRYGIRGVYFVLISFAFAELPRLIALNCFYNIFKGANGLLIPLKGNAPLLFQFDERSYYYYIIVGMFLAVLWVCRKMESSKMGYFLKAIRENELASEVSGVNVFRYKMAAMGLSAVLTSMGGAFYAQYTLFIDPKLAFGWEVSISMILPCVVGGLGTAIGPLIGSLLLVPIAEGIKAVFSGHSDLYLMFYGGLLVVFITFFPEGLMGWIQRWFFRKEEKAVGAHA